MGMLALGDHVFEVIGLNYLELVRQTEARWPAQPRFGGQTARQFTGLGENPIRLRGTLFPEELGGRNEYEALRATQIKGEPVMMVGMENDNEGRIHGRVVILTIEEIQDYIGPSGVGRRWQYEIELAPYPEDGP